MKTINKIYTAVTLAVMALTLASCDHKPLCYTHPHSSRVNVEFDWTEATGDEIPEVMSVYAFPHNGGDYIRYDLDAIAGGTIDIPAGQWDFLTVNPTSNYIQFRGLESYQTFEAFTRDADPMEPLGRTSTNAPRAAGTDNEAVRITPDHLWHQTLRDMEISGLENSLYTIVFTPTSPLCNYTVEIRNIEHLDGVSSISGSISGMGGAMFLTNRTHNEAPVTNPYGSYIQDDRTVMSTFKTFGNHSAADGHKVMVYAIMKDGKGYYSEADVTAQVKNAPDPRNVHIILDGLDLPKPITGGSGVGVDINDWELIEIDLVL